MRELRIERLGAQGDGVAHLPDGQPVYVPFTLPGELVRIDDAEGARAGSAEIVAPSPQRIAPVCRHFGVCGNCVAQHMDDALYEDWKRGIVTGALMSRGLDATVGPLRRVSVGSRRRTAFAIVRHEGRTILGYRRRRSHDVFEVIECPVLEPALVAAMPGLTSLAGSLAPTKGEARIEVTKLDSGLDVAVSGAKAQSGRALERLVRDALGSGIARLTIDDELIAQEAPPIVRIAGVSVPVPPGGFLQASREAEAILTELVLDGVGSSDLVADLFAGSGTFTLALATRSSVTAVESDTTALAALDKAMRGASGLKPVTLRRADLFRSPLLPRELDRFQAVVFDPPRVGAKEQAAALARSKVPRVVAVSCNPATLARDLRTLVDGGYRIERVTPVDQFVYAAEVEVAAVLAR